MAPFERCHGGWGRAVVRLWLCRHARDLAHERARVQVRPDDRVGVARDDRGRGADRAVAPALPDDETVEAGHVLGIRPERAWPEHEGYAGPLDIGGRGGLRR